MELIGNNPFKGYIEKLEKKVGKKVNPVHEIVNVYLMLRGLDKLPKKEYEKKKISYPRLAREAKTLLVSCENRVEDALWCLDSYNYIATKGGFNWTIGTICKERGKIKLYDRRI